MAQFGTAVGAFDHLKITDAYRLGVELGARLIVTPELAIGGYFPYELMQSADWALCTERVLQACCAVTVGKPAALAVGHVSHAQNCISVFENGKLVLRQAKTILPNRGIFFEQKFFQAAEKTDVWLCDGVRVVFTICEDLWGYHNSGDLKLESSLRVLAPDIVVSLSASPYEQGKMEIRKTVHQGVVQRLGVPLVYCNAVGASDELIFDGGSFGISKDGVLSHLPFFHEAVGVFCDGRLLDESMHVEGSLADALVLGIASYVKQSGFSDVILGLSGGIDSALVAVLAVEALGKEHVSALMMPSQFSSPASLQDARDLADRLGIKVHAIPIDRIYTDSCALLSEITRLSQLARENMQARVRALYLMAVSASERALVLTTGNKSELLLGYCTLYGDMAGALAPIGDLYKTEVYALAASYPAIGEAIMKKAPTAELAHGQKDEDSLPPYELLDAFLADVLAGKESFQSLSERYEPLLSRPGWTMDVLRRMDACEFKLNQAAPVLRVSSTAIGRGRMMPIVKKACWWQS